MVDSRTFCRPELGFVLVRVAGSFAVWSTWSCYCSSSHVATINSMRQDRLDCVDKAAPPTAVYSLHQAGSLHTKYHFPGDPGYTTSSIILTQQMSENITQLRESLPVRLEFPQQHWPSVYRPCLRLVCRAALSQLSSLSGPLESWRLTAWGAQNSAYTEHPASCTSVHTPTNSGSKIKYRF